MSESAREVGGEPAVTAPSAMTIPSPAPAAPSGGDSGRPEMYFLIADFLSRSSPCGAAAAALVADMESKGLLGTKREWRGKPRPEQPTGAGASVADGSASAAAPLQLPRTYADMRRSYDGIPRDHLATVLRGRIAGRPGASDDT